MTRSHAHRQVAPRPFVSGRVAEGIDRLIFVVGILAIVVAIAIGGGS